jgi:hypothetical protein
MNKPFKIECTMEELETIMTALNLEIERQSSTESKAYKLLSDAKVAVADFSTND